MTNQLLTMQITTPDNGNCPRCGGSGLTAARFTGENLTRLPTGWWICPCEAGQRAWEDFGREQMRERIERLFSLARIPTRFSRLTLGTYPTEHPAQRRVKDTVKRFIKNGVSEEGKESLLFYGPYGTGKTGLAIAILKAWIRQGKMAIFTTVPDLLDVIYASFDRNADTSYREVLDTVVSCDLLVLDDLGTEHPTQFVNTKLFQIVNARHDWQRATVFTTNLNKVDLCEWMGQRTFERISEMASLVLVDGPNLRACRKE
jgi:DNA replication protein DnaC